MRSLNALLAGVVLIAAGCGGGGSTGRPSTEPTMPETPPLFSGFNGSSIIPSAGRAALTSDSPFPSAESDAFPQQASLEMTAIQRVDRSTVRGSIRFVDPGAGLAAQPQDFANLGLFYPNKLVCEAGKELVLESGKIGFYFADYRNDLYHERAWWAVISGEATVNGVAGYTFSLYIEDRRNPGDPTDTRPGRDFCSLTIYSPDTPYGGMEVRDGMIIWGLQKVIYHNDYPLLSGDILAVGTPAEPAVSNTP